MHADDVLKGTGPSRLRLLKLKLQDSYLTDAKLIGARAELDDERVEDVREALAHGAAPVDARQFTRPISDGRMSLGRTNRERRSFRR